MSTALICFSVFFTGAVVSRRDAPASNTLMIGAFVSMLTLIGLLIKRYI